MSTPNYSIIRLEEHQNISSVGALHGSVLDVGGSKKSAYQKLFAGTHEFVTINIDTSCEPDHIVDIEKAFPFADNSFDHAVCFNVLEHVYEFENVVSETHRVVKPGGRYVVAVPFMYYRHGSPDDYFRYTESALRRLMEKHGFEVERIVPMGKGFFSLGFQIVGGTIPTNIVRQCCKHAAHGLDIGLQKISRRYRQLALRIPLGYFVVAVKK